jgi:hypothetical protein
MNFIDLRKSTSFPHNSFVCQPKYKFFCLNGQTLAGLFAATVELELTDRQIHDTRDQLYRFKRRQFVSNKTSHAKQGPWQEAGHSQARE